jgi:hypothetical protein
MHSVNKPSTDVPPIEGLIPDRPVSWQGMDVAWASEAKPVPVYLGRFPVRRSRGLDDVHLLGARYELTEAVVGGDAFGDGYFLEYFVAEQTTGRWSLHRLLQSVSVTYSEGDEEADYMPAVDVRDPRAFALADPPKWKVSAAVWPTSDGKPMTFLGQVELPDTELTRRLLTWETALFLFASGDMELQFKVVEQDTTAQSAEEHYRQEDNVE